jgi:O-antigen ligase
MKLNLHKYIAFNAFLFGVIICFFTQVTNVVLLVFCAFVLINFFVQNSKLISKESFENFIKVIYKNKTFLFFSTWLLIIPLFLNIHIVSDFQHQILMVFKRSFYLLFPIVFLMIDEDNRKKVFIYFFYGLSIGAVVSSVVLLINILIIYSYSIDDFYIDKSLFNYYHTSINFTRLLQIHPTYYGMFLLSAVGFLFLYLKPKIIYFLALIPLLLAFIFVSSRVIFALLFLLFLIIGFKFLRSKLSKALSILSLVLFFLLSAILFQMFFKNTYVYDRITKATFWDLKPNIDQHYYKNIKADSRMSRWLVIGGLIAEQPFKGYGAYNEKKVLNQAFLKNNMTHSVSENYDSHSQFLGYAIESGFLGTFFLLVFLLSSILYSIYYKNTFAVYFFLSIFIICLFENYLNRNSGINFVAFIANLFLLLNHSKNESPANNAI